MKSIIEFIREAQQKYPIVFADVKAEDDRIDWDDAIDNLETELEGNGGAIVVYESPKSVRAKREPNENKIYSISNDAGELVELIRKHSDNGFRITYENEYTLGISFYISGPLPPPLYYVRVTKDSYYDVMDVDDELKDLHFPQDFQKLI